MQMGRIESRSCSVVALTVLLVVCAAAQDAGPAHQDDLVAAGPDAGSVADAPPAVTPVEREIESELARRERALEQISQLRDEMTQARAELDLAAERSGEHVAELTVALRAVAAESEQADQLYESIVAELQAARRGLAEALETWRAPSEVPLYSPGFDLTTVEVVRLHERIEAGRELMASLRGEENALRGLETDLRWRAVEISGDRVRHLNGQHITSMELLTPARRERVFGLSRDGIDQLRREVYNVALTTRLYRETRLHQLREARALARDVFLIGSLSYLALRLAVVVAVILVVRARWSGWLDRLRRYLFRRARTLAQKRRNDRAVGVLRALGPWLWFLIAVTAVAWALEPVIAVPELGIVVQVALIYGLYRLAVEVIVAVIATIGRHYRLHVAADRQAKLVTTVRWVMRIATPIVVLVVVSSRVLGRGYLYHQVTQIAWLVLAATTLAIVFSWRQVAAEAFLEVQPIGRLANLVRTSTGRWYGVLITPACFLWMAGRALLALARDFALGFEQTRRGLAFIFRRRIERQAEVRGYAEAEIEELPAPVVEAFTEEAVSTGPLVVDHFPGLDGFHAALRQWREHARGGAFLLTGERGCGKTTWLGQIATGDLHKTVVTLDRRPTDNHDLARLLGGALRPEVERECTLDELSAHLEDGSPRVVVVDLAQHLFLAAVGGYAVFDAFAELVERTHHRVFWLCAMSELAWQRLRAVRPTPFVFRHHQRLAGWSEEQIRELIRTRVDASGLRLNYSDLVVDRMEGVSAQARLIESEEGYTRLLWDYSDGNPRVALHFFLRSLVPATAGSARVRLFRAPPVEALAALDDSCLFTLAAVITHENVSLGEAAVVTRNSEGVCRMHLDRLLELGVLWAEDDRYRTTPYWHRAAVRLLRRRNLLMG
jgi:hypothetical protein